MRLAADNLLKLAADADLRKTLGRRAAAVAGKRFGVQAAADELRGIYAALTQGHT